MNMMIKVFLQYSKNDLNCSLKNWVMLGFLQIRNIGKIINASNWITNWTFNLLKTMFSAFLLPMKNQNVNVKRHIVERTMINLMVVLLLPWSSLAFPLLIWTWTCFLSNNSILTWTKIMKRISNKINLLMSFGWPVWASSGFWFVKKMKVTPLKISTLHGMIRDKAVTRSCVVLATLESSYLLNHAWWKMEIYLIRVENSNKVRYSKIKSMVLHYLIKTVTKICRKKTQTLM